MAEIAAAVAGQEEAPPAGRGPRPSNTEIYEKAAFSKDPNAPFAALRDSAIESFRKRAETWEIGDRMAVMTLTTELRYLRKKVTEQKELLASIISHVQAYADERDAKGKEAEKDPAMGYADTYYAHRYAANTIVARLKKLINAK